MDETQTINFSLNGVVFREKNSDIGTSLNSWLRNNPKLTGTKIMCKEGGCGACVVMVTTSDPMSGKDVKIAVNSCLYPLLSVDGCQVTTAEGLISDGGQYNDIQKRLACFSATQCGYCTPGFVMTMYSLLQKNPHPTQEEIESEFDGNICRCTGFRSIFDAMKSFAIDADPKLKEFISDIEDIKVCSDDGMKCKDHRLGCRNSCGRYRADGGLSFLHKKEGNLKQAVKPNPIKVTWNVNGGESKQWLRPGSLKQLADSVKINASKRLRFVVGNTSTGIFKFEKPYDVYIDTKLVPELYEIKNDETSLTLGANVSLNNLISIFEQNSSHSVTFNVMAKHIKKIANVPVRNVGSWVGNLSMKRIHPEFPSDLFTLFEAYSVRLEILTCSTGNRMTCSLLGDGGFMHLDMSGKVVLSVIIPKVISNSSSTQHAMSYKVMPRSQNAHAYVNAAFSAVVTGNKLSKPVLVYGGISKSFFHATATEEYLTDKDINSQDTLNGALQILEKELSPESYSATDSSPIYRVSAAVGLFYKFYLSLCNKSVRNLEVSSAIENIQRPVTSGTQTFDINASMYPVHMAIPKVTAIKQASGEAKYLSDFTALSDELFAAFVPSTVANADIDHIDVEFVKKMPGFHSLIAGADLPSEINNTYMPPPDEKQCIIAESHVEFAGQPLAIVLADTQDHAEAISRSVVVTYKNRKPAVYEISEAIEKEMFYDSPDSVVIEDAPTAIKNASRKVTGTVKIGSQYHFYMETQITRATPTEDGFQIESATQGQNKVQRSLSHMLGWDCNRFNIVTPRIGGAFGGKASNSLLTATAATLASFISGRPVRLHSNLERNMETYGSRSAYVADYSVGFDNKGKLEGILITYYANCGASPNDADLQKLVVVNMADSGYHCPAWHLNIKWVKTNIASSTWCRAPTMAEMVMIMEVIQEHIAYDVGIDPIEVKQNNLYVENQLNLFGEPLIHCNIRKMSEELLSSAEIEKRQTLVAEFNNANKWKKRGIGFTPMKLAIVYNIAKYSTQVSIFRNDGSVVLSAGGIESGQGMYTKLMQVASYVLGAPMDLIRVKAPDLSMNPNSGPTAASMSSELCCKGIMECCKILKSRMDIVKEKLTDDMTWSDKISKCFENGVNLTSQYWVFNNSKNIVTYNCYGAALTEAELDIITGEFVLRRVDMLYDCGKSINPAIDIGQAEGAFMMGVGLFTSEKMVFGPESGQLVSNNTWEYKPPASKDIPTVWNIKFLHDSPNPNGILSSKASGEPPLCTSPSVIFALKRCIEAFRQDSTYFAIDLPATVENIQQLCKIKLSDYTI
uniref:indole-3-acetaldehyde oxidase-like n=1 Tax=Styela clava TaxID=7725 RepID=UPI0019392E83|nr:indole-3-acetaldehyde oxidase-like [Styela clava]